MRQLRECLIETLEQFLIAINTLATDYEGWADIVVYETYALILVELEDRGEVAREVLPMSLERHYARCSSLKVHVVGSGSTALRSVVEHEQLRIVGENTVDLSIFIDYCLWLMLEAWQCEMLRKDREWVDEEFEDRIALRVPDGVHHLLLRTIGTAEEARALLE